MGKLRSWEGECLTLLRVEWGFKLEPFGPSPWDIPLCCTACAYFSLLRWCRFSLPCMSWEQKGMKRDWLHQEMESISENGAQWMHGCLGNRFPLITRNQFLSGKAIQEMKRVLWAWVSPSIAGTSNMSQVPGWQWCCRRVQGSHAELAWVLSEVSRFPLDMTLCDPVIWLPSSNTQSASKGLIIYSYAVRRFQEWFPSGILISTL